MYASFSKWFGECILVFPQQQWMDECILVFPQQWMGECILYFILSPQGFSHFSLYQFLVAHSENEKQTNFPNTSNTRHRMPSIL
jgi:hypothetical protein